MTLLVLGMLGFYFSIMSKKIAIVFIDGNNFYHNAKNVINPSLIDFTKLSKFICTHFNLDIKEIRYYNSIPDISDNRLTYHKHMEFLSDLKKQNIKVFSRKLQKTSTKEALKERKEVIDSLDFCEICKPLSENICSECIGKIKKREKGIDVLIAVDIIRKSIIENKCDVCILISGDADFIPAMQTIKNFKKEVITVSVFPGYSRQLREGKFRYFYLKKEDLITHCFKDYKEVKRKR